MKALVVNALGGRFEPDDVEIAAPIGREVLVDVQASGLCHTDVLFATNNIIPMPAVLGHEVAGIVAEVGPDVQQFKVGDHVRRPDSTLAVHVLALASTARSDSRTAECSWRAINYAMYAWRLYVSTISAKSCRNREKNRYLFSVSFMVRRLSGVVRPQFPPTAATSFLRAGAHTQTRCSPARIPLPLCPAPNGCAQSESRRRLCNAPADAARSAR
jgi:hypothetical protein